MERRPSGTGIIDNGALLPNSRFLLVTPGPERPAPNIVGE